MATLWRRHRIYTAWGMLLLLQVPVLVVLGLVDGREVDGVGVWVQPLKFALSLGVYVLTLAYLRPFMRKGARQPLIVEAVAIAAVLESLWLLSASALGIRSHYNGEGLFAIFYRLAGLGAFVLVPGALTQGISTLRASRTAANRALSLSVGWGLVLHPLFLRRQYGGLAHGLWRGVLRLADGGRRSSCRPFFATHALQAVPLAGLLLPRLFSVVPARWGIRAAAAGYTVFVLALAWGSIRGDDLPTLFRSPLF
jgi:hypothetical protein